MAWSDSLNVYLRNFTTRCADWENYLENHFDGFLYKQHGIIHLNLTQHVFEPNTPRVQPESQLRGSTAGVKGDWPGNRQEGLGKCRRGWQAMSAALRI